MDIHTLTVGGSDMQIHIARPAEKSERGIIVLQEVFGVNDYMRRMTERFAERGYLAVAPELFHRTAPPGFEAAYTDFPSIQPHMQALTDDGIVEDVRACFDWLVEAGIPENNIAVLGFCKGGYGAFLANTELPVTASVSFYGGGIAQNLLPRVGELNAPQLLIWGGADANIPIEHARAVSDAMLQAEKPFVEATFSEAGHAFARDVGDGYHESSAAEAWALVDAFLANNVK